LDDQSIWSDLPSEKEKPSPAKVGKEPEQESFTTSSGKHLIEDELLDDPDLETSFNVINGVNHPGD